MKCYIKNIHQTSKQKNIATNKRIKLGTRKRKGGNLEYDYLPAIDLLIDTFNEWLPERKKLNIKKRPYFFISSKTKTLFKTRSGWLKDLCKKARVRRFTLHGIRHLAALFLYYNGQPAQVIQAILRHKDPRTTSHYLKRIGAEEGRAGLNLFTEQLSQAMTGFSRHKDS